MHKFTKTRILIVDNDVDYCTVYTQQINMFDDMVCCGVAHDGKEAIIKIKDTLPDVVVIDFNLPIIDGLGVLEYFNCERIEKMPKFLAISSSNQKFIMNLMLENGAHYFLRKPFSMDTFISRIRLISSQDLLNSNAPGELTKMMHIDSNPDEYLKKQISKHILELGVATKLIGFEYIQNLMFTLMTCTNTRPTLVQMYRDIADRYGTDSRCVENAVSGAIKSAVLKHTPAMQNLVQLAELSGSTSLSNGKFLTLAVQSLKLNAVAL